ncbi:hypothetical protein, variant [Phialophora macrospora]|uniref:Major facilitator superfamily (MFS) profile domain-containing protein n=1 Tax=Phialophora macrospora TaxID=1851006 RepID=A0A0D2DLP2_9EURO|nr:hypothetical protein, variant [Phialophora macrospora]
MANLSNALCYAAFVFSGLAAPTILNRAGPRLTLMVAITGYPVFIGAMWYFDAHGHLWFPAVAGLILGVAGGLLWATAAFVANGYSEESNRGTWRSIQWTSNVTGATVGGCVALGAHMLTVLANSLGVPHSVYIVFICIQLASLSLGFFMLPPDRLRRNDGTSIAEFHPHTPFMKSLKGTLRLFKDPKILIMIPAFFTAEMFFPLMATVNAFAFNLRTRTLNSMLGNAIQIPLTLGMGWLLDNEKFGSRKRRGFIAITFNAVYITGAYIALIVWLKSWNFQWTVPGPSIDCTDDAYPGAVVVYLLMVSQYGIFQNVMIWVFGSFTNDPENSAHISGLFIACISAGTSISFATSSTEQPFINVAGAFFALTTLCWPILGFVVWKYTSDTRYFQEETVTVPLHVRKEKGMDVHVGTAGSSIDVSSTAVDKVDR